MPPAGSPCKDVDEFSDYPRLSTDDPTSEIENDGQKKQIALHELAQYI